MSKLEKNLEKKDIILLIIVVFLIMVNLVLYISNKPQEEEIQPSVNVAQGNEENNKTNKAAIPKSGGELTQYLSTLGERDRIEYYTGQYFKHLEKKEYESAYNLLYDEFKQNYFPTLDEYIAYIEKTYPKSWALQYEDITRQGEIYVLKLNILDLIQATDESKKEQRIVIREDNYNDYVLSFQVL